MQGGKDRKAYKLARLKARFADLIWRRKPVTGILLLALLVVAAFGLFLIPTGEEGTETAGVSEDKVNFVAEYADAYCARDGDVMAGFYIDEETALSDVLLMEKTGDSYTFGLSSPWPDEFRFVAEESEENGGGTAQIWYYAWTSDPHIVVWKEEMTFAKTAEGYRVTDSALTFLDSIASKEEFDEAYRIGDEYRFTDYEERGFVEAVNSQTVYDADEGVKDRNAFYRNPGKAAAWICNLTGGQGEMLEHEGMRAVVRYTFADGSSVTIPMKNANAGAGTDSFPESEPVWIVDLEEWRLSID